MKIPEKLAQKLAAARSVFAGLAVLMAWAILTWVTITQVSLGPVLESDQAAFKTWAKGRE